jgi:hypothetical protein
MAREHEEVLVEKEGRVFRIEATEERVHDPERLRSILRLSRGALKTVDIEALKRDLREARQQDSEGRPA